MYLTLSFEPLQDSLLGISLLVKGCIWNMLGNDGWKTRAIQTKTESSKTFRATKVPIVSSYSPFLKNCQKKLMGTGLPVRSWKSRLSSQPTGLFMETSLTGILGGVDYDTADVALPFFEPVIDNRCALDQSADTKTVWTAYVNMVSNVCRKRYGSWWTEENINRSGVEIQCFKHIIRKSLKVYWAA